MEDEALFEKGIFESVAELGVAHSVASCEIRYGSMRRMRAKRSMTRTSKPAARKTAGQRRDGRAATLDALIEEATVDAYDESEQKTGGIMFGLLDRLDEGRDDVFFADEGDAWQVGVDWAKVLPPWFKVLAATAEPEEYAQRIAGVLDRHYSYGRTRMLAVQKIATPAQRNTLRRSQPGTRRTGLAERHLRGRRRQRLDD